MAILVRIVLLKPRVLPIKRFPNPFLLPYLSLKRLERLNKKLVFALGSSIKLGLGANF